MTKKAAPAFIAAFASACWTVGCVPSEPNVLADLSTVDLRVGSGQVQAWVAKTTETRNRGLMYIQQDDMADLPDGKLRGMLFVFRFEQQLGFWMKNTIIPLDIIYLKADGTVVNSLTMAPLDTSNYYSDGTAKFALELNAGMADELGVAPGDHIEIPDSVLKNVQ